LQGCGAAGEVEAREGAFAEADAGGARRGGDHEGSDEEGEVGVVADDQYVFMLTAFLEECVEVFEGGFGGEGLGEQNVGVVAHLVGDERGGLEASLEGARDDEVEVYVEGVEDVGELEAVTLAVFVEGTFGVEERVGAGCTGACVPENEEVHKASISLLQRGSEDFAGLVGRCGGFVVEDAGIWLVQGGDGGFRGGDGVW
jgi:hypothetical protein